MKSIPTFFQGRSISLKNEGGGGGGQGYGDKGGGKQA